MAVTIEQLTSPLGEIDPAVLFPEDAPADFAFRIQAYIADGVSRATTNDVAVNAWAYHRAYSARYVQMASEPHTGELPEGGSYSYLVSQMNAIRDRAAYWLGVYEDEVAVTPVADRVVYATTRAVANSFVW